MSGRQSFITRQANRDQIPTKSEAMKTVILETIADDREIRNTGFRTQLGQEEINRAALTCMYGLGEIGRKTGYHGELSFAAMPPMHLCASRRGYEVEANVRGFEGSKVANWKAQVLETDLGADGLLVKIKHQGGSTAIYHCDSLVLADHCI